LTLIFLLVLSQKTLMVGIKFGVTLRL